MKPYLNYKRAILLFSGGIDSTTLLAELRQYRVDVTCLIFDYGQSLHKEIEVAKRSAQVYGAQYLVLDTPLNDLTPGCSLIDPAVAIATGRTLAQIRQGGTPTSYVPFRNGIFFAYATAYGEAHDIPHILAGCNGLNSGNYWDDTVQFGYAFSAAAQVGTSPDYVPELDLPYARLSKAEIVQRGKQAGVNYGYTWSCYNNGDRHCGICDSCVQRQHAMQANGLTLAGGKS